MAEGTKLVLEFYDSDDRTAQFTFNYAKPSAGAASIKALMAGMIENTQIFARQLVSVKGAKEVTTSENVYDLEDITSRAVYNANPDVDVSSDVVRVSKYSMR